MSIAPLSTLVIGYQDSPVHVYVSRLWQHRGATDVGPIKHTDIVFQDVEGDFIYGEIAAPLVDKFLGQLEEGKVYELRRFLVSKMKNWFRPVDNEVMIRFGRYTTVQEVDNDVMDYPLCTYALTPIDALPSQSDTPQSFTDVVGIITGVTSTSVYHSASRSTPSTKRVIYLSDLSGYEITLVLWGERATAFNGPDILRIGQGKPVVAVFVGTLVKPFEGRRGLSGGAPCRWYINEDLPEINAILTQLKNKVPIIRDISLEGQTAAEITAQVDLETKTVKELLTLDIWKHRKDKFYCTVLLSKLKPGERWWFHGCTACGKRTIPYGDAYKCPDTNCASAGGAPRYRICYIASDGIDEVELMFFEKSGRELIGKPPLSIMRSKVPAGMSIEDAIQFARTDQSTPRELASVVSRKYRLVVSVTTKSLDPSSLIPAYQVHRIDQEHGKQNRGTPLGRRHGLAIASTSSSNAGSGLSPSGETLAGSLGFIDTNSSETVVGASDAPVSIDMPASLVASGTNLPQTPKSVSKPAQPTVENSPVISEVKRALLMEPSPEHEVRGVKNLPPPTDVTKTALAFLPAPDSPHASSSTNTDKSTTKVEKSPVISEAKRFLLMEPSPEREVGGVKDLPPPADVTKTALAFLPAPDSPHASSTTNTNKSTTKRKQAPKGTGDESKKRGKN